MNDATPPDGGYLLDEFDGPRFWAHVDFHGGRPYLGDPLSGLADASGECWPWRGKNTGGSHPYGQFEVFGRFEQAPTIAFRDFGGNIPHGMLPDHLCRNTLCVRPSHLDPVTQKQNVGRGIAALPRVDVCPHGHEYTEANTYRKARGRECRTCRRERKSLAVAQAPSRSA